MDLIKKENIKVMLVRPPQLFYHGTWPQGPRLSIPIGLLSLGSYLDDHGVDVDIYDCFVEWDNVYAENDSPIVDQWMSAHENYSAIKNNEKEVDSKKLGHFGASWEQFSDAVRERSPDIIGITNLFRENTSETLEAARIVKSIMPNSCVVIGGPNATANYEYMLNKCKEIDIVAIGDGEQTLMDIIQLHEGKIDINSVKDISYLSSGKLVCTDRKVLVNDLDTLGDLNYDLIKLERYHKYESEGVMSRNKFSYFGSERAVSLCLSRGCPYKCVFCSVHVHAGRKFRTYSVEHALNHIENLVKNYGVKHIHFEDDNLTLDKKRFMRLMKEIVNRKLIFTWDTPNGVFANTIDMDMLKLMKKTGCTYLILGVESGDQWVLDNIIKKQPLRLDIVINVFQMAKKVGIDMQAFYIIGFPGETKALIQKTLDFAIDGLKRYDVIPHIAIARADPGTELFKDASDNGLLVENYSITNASGVHADMFSRHLITTDQFSPEYLERVNTSAHKKAIITIGLHTFLFLIKHPGILYSTIRHMVYDSKKLKLKESIVKIFFTRLFYKNSMVKYSKLLKR